MHAAGLEAGGYSVTINLTHVTPIGTPIGSEKTKSKRSRGLGITFPGTMQYIYGHSVMQEIKMCFPNFHLQHLDVGQVM